MYFINRREFLQWGMCWEEVQVKIYENRERSELKWGVHQLTYEGLSDIIFSVFTLAEKKIVIKTPLSLSLPTAYQHPLTFFTSWYYNDLLGGIYRTSWDLWNACEIFAKMQHLPIFT